MKYLRRLSCVLLVAVILSVTFSITAAAETVDNYILDFDYYYSDDTTYSSRVFPLGSVDTFDSFDVGYCDNSAEMGFYYSIYTNNQRILAKKDLNTKVTLTDIHLLLYLTKWVYPKKFSSLEIEVTYIDGSIESFDNVDYSFNNPYGTLTAEFEPKNDVVNMIFYLQYSPHYADNINGSGQGTIEFSSHQGQKPLLDITQSSEESGLLKGLIEWVKGIFQKIGDGFQAMIDGFSNVVTKLTEGFKNIVDSLLELPAKLWQLISDGLKDLFVPDEQFMTNYSDEWDFLLGQRFGALYEVADIIRDFISDIQYSDTTNTISMPLVDLTSAGIPFSFGGYDVQIVPSGFETLVNVCKKILSAICTFMFINSLRKRYDEVMGVEQ